MDFLDLTHQVAAELGDGWRAERGYMTRRHAVLAGPADQSLTITHGDDSSRHADHGRLRIEGTYTRFSAHRYRGDPDHVITVAAHRPPARIAADIARRLLPGYQRTLDGYRARACEDAAVLARRDAVLDELAAVLAPVHRSREGRIDFGDLTDPVSASIRVLRSGEAELKLRLGRDRVLNLAHHLAAQRTIGTL
ncbi:hypothetical protein [Nocardia sp. CA-120079]|uniref:hypothetical protein n=1 Tax=Nocardia sp. CA-120079 TaxID=3239974 RepID=UPI003D95A2E7